MENNYQERKISGMKFGIIGLGLIGGSIALALKEKAGINRIAAIDADESTINAALKMGLIEEGFSPEYQKSYECLKDCDIVFVCTPVAYVKDTLLIAAANCDGIITDTGSTKKEIMKDIKHKRFIGGHPMAGSERSGFSAASARLLENAIYVICNGSESDPEDVELLKTVITKIGALPIVMDPVEHDTAVGFVSHLPHVVAACLANTVSSSDKNGILRNLAAGGFKDITRIASSNPAMWAGISMQTREALLEILERYNEDFNSFKTALSDGDFVFLEEFFKKARDYRDSIPAAVKGMLPSEPEISVDVADTPGVLGKVTTILGEYDINIRNIYIQNSREYEGGCLRISLSGEKTGVRAVEILEKAGYKCRLIST